jgi:hypothetical protein
MKKIIFSFFLLLSLSSRADEGMWLPVLLEQLNQSDMASMGLKLTADDIYSVNHSSLKDAIVLFGGGCTAELISDKGLIITNHHCGYSSVQSHSTLENDYLTNGFWATSQSEELSNSSLSVTFLVSMEDVTLKVLKGVTSGMSEAKREAIIAENIKALETEAVKETKYKAKIKPFYYGNEYYLFITQVFNDVRLVGAPPSSIGKFGGDTDNWAWPRHTGDFSLFRIYADKNNEPAEYSKDNVPYIPKKSLTISLKGVKEGDFAMVYGFPGRTQEYLTSYAVNLIANKENPAMISIRDKKLGILSEAMKSDPLIKLQYSSKYATVANYWKKWIGESRGIKKMNGVGKKQELEAAFLKWVQEDKQRSETYGSLLSGFSEVYQKLTPLSLAYDYFVEAGLGVEIVRYAWGFNNLINKSLDKTVKDDEITKLVEQLKKGATGFFKNYNLATDKKIFEALIKIYHDGCDPIYLPSAVKLIDTKYSGDYSKYTSYVYGSSVLTSEKSVLAFLNSFKRTKASKLKNDPAFMLASSIYNNYYDNVMGEFNNLNDKIDSLSRIYITGLREMQPDKKFYPDANSTMRLAYGKVQGYKPNDGVYYNYYTTLNGIIQKEDPDVDDYIVSDKLKELYKKKDFGIYSSDSTMRVAFISTVHTTGGNSGSPVLNANGELIGVNFDRVWEGTMSDIMFDSTQCRNIAIDIRYALFIVDKYAGAGWLLKEMNFSK